MRRFIHSIWVKLFYVLFVVWVMLRFYGSVPDDLFRDPSSTLVESCDGRLLSAIIADDMQWRFPEQETVPEKFSVCLREFEDRYFLHHPGVNPISVWRALLQNLRAGHRVSGASTLSMQTIRLSRKGKPRNIVQKVIESIMALRLEMKYSKEEILCLYVSNAPFGGNVVGLEAAAWRYYGRPPSALSWGESATMAVLPNAPGLIFPGRNKKELREKRDRLLKQLFHKNYIDTSDYHLSLQEPLPGAPHSLPQKAPHLLTHCLNDGKKGERIVSTLDYDLQIQLEQIVSHHQTRLDNNGIQNMAVLIINNKKNQVAAYTGNSISGGNHEMIDMISARRSTGSILKPFLYAGMLQQGKLLPEALVRDVPSTYGNYRPSNFNKQYSGAVPASRALNQSLNVPCVHMLNSYGVTPFYEKLKQLGFSTLRHPPGHYGLSLILGGAEATLWDLTNAYALLSQTLLFDSPENSANHPALFQAGYDSLQGHGKPINSTLPFQPSAVWYTLKAIQKTNRPSSHSGWQNFYSSPQVAWKTGTSHGNRDAWAIGITPAYTIGVWCGNADGEGRAELTGIKAAAPVLFHVFDLLKPQGWFKKPLENMKNVKVCSRSGFKASGICPQTKFTMAPENAAKSPICPYHKIIHLNKNGNFQVNANCTPIQNMTTETWFVLPPLMEKYYKTSDPFYKPLPPFKDGCGEQSQNILEVIYPEDQDRIFLPRDITSSQKQVIFKAAHKNQNATLFWFIDKTFIATTKGFHEISVVPEKGEHTLHITDINGNSVKRRFHIYKN
ncbi:MAG: penicillin-binding protein 1C [Bacteroidales bacterium]